MSCGILLEAAISSPRCTDLNVGPLAFSSWDTLGELEELDSSNKIEDNSYNSVINQSKSMYLYCVVFGEKTHASLIENIYDERLSDQKHELCVASCGRFEISGAAPGTRSFIQYSKIRARDQTILACDNLFRLETHLGVPPSYNSNINQHHNHISCIQTFQVRVPVLKRWFPKQYVTFPKQLLLVFGSHFAMMFDIVSA